jgi:hypothetical protein
MADTKRDEQGLNDGWLCLQGRENTLCHIHELRGVSVNCCTARACISGHRVVDAVAENSRQRLPPKHLRAIVLLQQADSSRIGTAKLQSRLGSFCKIISEESARVCASTMNASFSASWSGGLEGRRRSSELITTSSRLNGN